MELGNVKAWEFMRKSLGLTLWDARIGTVGDSSTLIAVEFPLWKGPGREAEAWDQTNTQERLWWKCSPIVERDPSILVGPLPWGDHQEQHWQWCGAMPEHPRQDTCVVEDGDREVIPTLWRCTEAYQQIPKIAPCIIYTIETWFFFNQIPNGPSFPLEVRNT